MKAHIVKLILSYHPIFNHHRCYKIPRVALSAGALITRQWEKFAIFDRNRRYLGTVRDRPTVAMCVCGRSCFPSDFDRTFKQAVRPVVGPIQYAPPPASGDLNS